MSDRQQTDGSRSAELRQAFGPTRLVPLRHPNQRNETWLVQIEESGRSILLKRYSHASAEKVSSVLEAESFARAAGVPVPPVVWRSADGLLVAYGYSGGVPGVPEGGGYVEESATLFVRQLRGLRAFVPTLAPVRPLQLPRRAQEAARNHADHQVSREIVQAWQRLGQWALRTPTTSSHVDWRSDNILCTQRGITAVLDWEDTVRLPAPEAVGYAAGSLTHSWRDGVYRPVTTGPVTRFLAAASTELGWHPRSDFMRHARLAALFTSAVRLTEDQRRNRAAVSLPDLQSAIGET